MTVVGVSALIWMVGLPASAPLAPTPAFAQSREAEKTAYLALLERLAEGDADAVSKEVLATDSRRSREIAGLIVEDVDAEMKAARRLTRNPADLVQYRRRRLRLLELTLRLHTEAAVRVLTPHEQLLIARDTVERLESLKDDFERNGPIGPSTAGSQPRSRGADWADTRALVRDWYLLVVSHLFTVRAHELLEVHIDEGLRRFDDDAELLLARGALRENQIIVSLVDRSLSSAIYTPELMGRWRFRVDSAIDAYDKAFRRQPGLHEARLRWGRLKALSGKRRDAGAAYSDVATSATVPFLRYLAHLFSAELAESSGDLDAARKEYEAALGERSDAQAPKLSLSSLCLRAGDRACADRWLRMSLSEVAVTRGDPWWDYVDGQAWLTGPRLAAFRARGLTP